MRSALIIGGARSLRTARGTTAAMTRAMGSTIQGNVARTRQTDSLYQTTQTGTRAEEGSAFRQFQADRDRDTFVRSSGSTGSTGSTGAGKLEGFDHNKLNDPNHNTPKYLVGRILQNYPNTPEGLRQALPEIQRHFPEARIVQGGKGDVLDFGSHTDPEGRPLGRIDVIRAAGGPNGGEGWQWLPIDQQPGGGVPSQAGAKPNPIPGGSWLEELFNFLKSPEGLQMIQQFLGKQPGRDLGTLEQQPRSGTWI